MDTGKVSSRFSTAWLLEKLVWLTHVLDLSIPDICTRFQKSNFTCPNGRAFFSSSIVWGVVGPHRMFGPGSIYSSIHYYWLIGAALPVIFFFLMRLAPKSPLRYLNAPVMLGAMGWLPPATPLSFSTWALWGLVFNYWIMRRFQGWWHKYSTYSCDERWCFIPFSPLFGCIRTHRGVANILANLQTTSPQLGWMLDLLYPLS